MPKRISKQASRPDKDLNIVQNAKRVFNEAINRSNPDSSITISRSTISFVMAEMGRKGGRIGGKRRLETMTPERRSEVGRLAALKRWGNKKTAKK